jgi:hypothetical protein
MNTYRYPLANIIGDYLRSTAGLLFVAIPAALTQLGTTVTVILAALAAIFLVYGARTVNRHLTEIELDDTGIKSKGGLSRQLRWRNVERLDLRYFSTRRDRQNGWMQLRLDGDRTVVRVDSQIDDWQQFVEQVCQMVPLSQITLGETTMVNLNSMGISAENWPASEATGASGES